MKYKENKEWQHPQTQYHRQGIQQDTKHDREQGEMPGEKAGWDVIIN
jgi:hypothetical protein